MANPERLTALIAEYRGLDPVREVARICPLLAEAAALVDREVEPKKWAALRGLYGRFATDLAPESALAAYLEALTVWNAEADREAWVGCHASVGLLYLRLHPLGSTEADQAIVHLELAVNDQQTLASTLGQLYRHKISGDPGLNWQQRFRYFQLALSHTSPAEQPQEWASYQNELGIAYSHEPNGDYTQGIEKRIACHMSAMQALAQSPQNPGWIENGLNLSEAYLFRVLGGRSAGRNLAEYYLKQVEAACNEQTLPDLHRRLYMSLARLRTLNEDSGSLVELREALTYFERAAQFIPPEAAPDLLAGLEALRINTYRQLISLGEKQWVEPLVASVGKALQGFDPTRHVDSRRTLLQSAADGLLAADEFAQASTLLQQALTAGETQLAQATTQAGRVECAFKLRDSAALLSYCQLKLGDSLSALRTLDRGKTRFWRSHFNSEAFAQLVQFIPADGAALFPVLSFDHGAVVIATRREATIHTETVWLPAFGKTRLMQLQRGGLSAPELGGWLKAYSYRRSQPQAWIQAINAMGGTLYDEVWRSVLEKLAEMGVRPPAELLWFPQGGCGLFPMHAAWHNVQGQRRWLIEDYAVRYAPSLQSLTMRSELGPAGRPALVVGNPRGDLPFSDLECIWVERILGKNSLRIFQGAAANKDAVLAALPGCSAAHFSTHAMFDFADPFRSSIALANQQVVTLQELLPLMEAQPPTFVVLSACESGLARVTGTADEFLGFPAAFLEHGTCSVLSTLWAVDDASSSLLVQRFYREYRRGEISTCEALRRAQNWLRTATVADVSDTLAELQSEPAPVGPFASRVWTDLFALDPLAQPYAEPYFWAAFTLWGT